jgi:uncharacterized repeat protein (TIGR03803 family)
MSVGSPYNLPNQLSLTYGNNEALVLFGNSQNAGDTITIYATTQTAIGASTTVIGTVTSHGNFLAAPSFSATIPIDLPDGTYSITTTETNNGQTSAPSSPVTLVIAAPPPTNPSEKSMPSNGGTIELTGKGDAPGDTVTIYNGTQIVGAGVVDANGNYDIITSSAPSIANETFADGTYHLTATDTSVDGTVTSLPSNAFGPPITLGAFDGVNNDGAYPQYGSLVSDAAGDIYGTTLGGGSQGQGTVFELAKGASAITTLASFDDPNSDTAGLQPISGLTIDSAGDIYGTTSYGGDSGNGTVFEIAKGSTTVTTIASFEDSNGSNPIGGLTIDSNGDLFGTTSIGGDSGNGTVFEIVAGTSTITTLASFEGTNGSTPQANLTLDSAGNLYGTTQDGGANDDGTVFEIAKGSSAITTIASFNGANGSYPLSNLVTDSAGDLFGTTDYGGANNDGTIFEIKAGSSTVTTLFSFNGANGANPHGNLIADSAGNLFGTTYQGGPSNDGTVFELIHGTSTLVTLDTFNGTNGANPVAGLMFDSDYNLYGTTSQGGPNGDGTIFEIPSLSNQVVAAPAPTNLAQEGTATNGGTIEVTGDGDAVGDTITVSLSSGNGPATIVGTTAVVAGANGGPNTFDFTVPGSVADGTYTVTATDTSVDGTVTSDASSPLQVTVGAPAPTNLVEQGTAVNGGPIEVTGVGDAVGDTITLYAATAKGAPTKLGTATVVAGANGGPNTFDFTASGPFTDGTYAITATDTSVDGTVTSTASAPLTIEIGAAAPSHLAAKGTATAGGPIEITGTGDTVGDIITIFNGKTAVGTGKVATNGSFDIKTSSTFAAGTYNLTATDTSIDGTVTSSATALNVTVQAAPANASTGSGSTSTTGSGLGGTTGPGSSGTSGTGPTNTSGPGSSGTTQPALVSSLDPTSQAVEHLYIALLGQPADSAGLALYNKQYNAHPTIHTLHRIAGDLLASTEFKSLHGHLNNNEFVEALYEGALGRSAEQSALHQDVHQLHSGLSRAALAVSVAESPEAAGHLASHPIA